MPEPLFDALNFSGGGGGTATAPAPRQSQGFRVMEPGGGQAARQRAQRGASAPAGGARIEPLTSARYNMKPGPAPQSRMPALPPTQAGRPGPAAQPQAPKYNPATYDPVAEYSALRGRLGFPAQAPAPMPVHPSPPATGMAETFMAPAQESAATFNAARTAQGAGRFAPVNGAMAKVGQYGLEGGFMPRMGTPAQAGGAVAATALAGAVNNPQAALHAATHPIGTAFGMGRSAANAVINPHQSWGDDFTAGMARLLGGEVGAGEMAGAVGDVTGVRPVFNAGMKMGGTLRNMATDPMGTARQFGRGMGAIGNSIMGY
jgi:hypothetical protein